MRKRLVGVLWMCIALAGAWTAVVAAPVRQGAQAVISSPADNGVVRGTVPIVGTAIDQSFWKYEVYFASEGTEQWVLVGSIHETQVADGLLETWETTIVPDGNYSLRLRVVNRTGNYQEVHVRGIMVANAAPTDTPEPTETSLPTATQTTAPSPTFIIPESPLAQPTATPTLARPTRSALPDALDINTWRQSLCLGAQLMAIILVALAVIFVVRQII